MLGPVNHLKQLARAPDNAARAEVGFTPCAHAARGRDAALVMRIIADPVAVYLWLAVIVVGVAAMLIVGDARVFLIGWAAGGLAAAVLADVRAQRQDSH
jgi:hypothetical protein